MTVEQLALEALSLSTEERALLADRLVESLDPGRSEETKQAWITEALRRLGEFRSGSMDALSSDMALAQARKRLATR